MKALLAAPVVSAASAQDYGDRLKGLPSLTIKDVKVITTTLVGISKLGTSKAVAIGAYCFALK